MHGTHHAVTEIGLGNLLDRLNQALNRMAGGKPPEITVAEYSLRQRPCLRFDVVDAAADGVSNSYRTLVYFDRETNLPVRYEAYDHRGNLLESFTYLELRFNTGLNDAAFP
jgi:outer membrane lipoprotein-sorting protein